jgi:hypothetical protein
MQQDFYFHIGFPKTGTSHLQTIFPQTTALYYLGKPRPVDPQQEKIYMQLRDSVRNAPGIWRTDPEAMIAKIQSLPNTQQLPYLMSDEMITTVMVPQMPGGGYRKSSPSLIAENFAHFRKAWKKHGRVRVLMSFRRQDEWLASQYANEAKWTPFVSQGGFERFVDRLLSYRAEHNFSAALEYDWLYQQYCDALGAENVCFLMYEDMRDAPEKFSAELAAFTGIDERLLVQNIKKPYTHKLSADKHWTWRARGWCYSNNPWCESVLALLRSRSENPENWRSFVNIKLTEQMSKRILDAYSGSNQRLFAALGRDTSTYDYRKP